LPHPYLEMRAGNGPFPAYLRTTFRPQLLSDWVHGLQMAIDLTPRDRNTGHSFHITIVPRVSSPQVQSTVLHRNPWPCSMRVSCRDCRMLSRTDCLQRVQYQMAYLKFRVLRNHFPLSNLIPSLLTMSCLIGMCLYLIPLGISQIC